MIATGARRGSLRMRATQRALARRALPVGASSR
jgi:hypothetical protein